MKCPSNQILFLFCFSLGAMQCASPILSQSQAGEPKFQRQVVDGDIQIGYGLALGRVDADDSVDILLADKKEIAWYQNPGDGADGGSKEWTKHVIARNLTARDNVCLAARDIDGDGLVEIAVGANWNPGDTNNAEVSGTSFYLQRPADPTKPWKPVALTPHEPTTHRMHWIRGSSGKMKLAVLPLHGVGNKGGKGKEVSISLFEIDGGQPKLSSKVETTMHATHNFELAQDDEFGEQEIMLIGGSEGYVAALASGDSLSIVENPLSKGAGEVRRYPIAGRAFVGIEPMHGTDVVLYRFGDNDEWSKEVIDTTLNQGHALAAADLFGDATPEIIAGWRGEDSSKKIGIKIYSREGDGWKTHWLDDNQIACEDLKVIDLNGDGKLDIVGAGRGTKNVVVYWNQTQ